MPWKTSTRVDQRVQFIAAADTEVDASFSELCRRFGISRKTGYKWLERYNEGGPAQLEDRRSSPKRVAAATPVERVADILKMRKDFPTWGPKKLRRRLRTLHPDKVWPAVSTISEILKRHGLIVPRRRRVRWVTPRADRPVPDGPNHTWCVDFKGDFALGDGTRCYPLTVTDLHSRMILCITAFRSTATRPVREEFERLFATYGLPERIRSDNGNPFSTTAPGGLSALSVRWIALGIVPELIEPGHPEQNGAHERMHRTLKAEATLPAEANLAAQQVRLDRFRAVFNAERPHEALGQEVPASRYHASPRELPTQRVDPSYAEGVRKLRVSAQGGVELKGKRVRVHGLLKGELIGLTAMDEQRWEVFFGPVRLGVIDTSEPKPRLRPVR